MVSNYLILTLLCDFLCVYNALFSALCQLMGKFTCQSLNLMTLLPICFLNDCKKQPIVMICKAVRKMI